MPSTYQDLYTQLDTYLTSFNTSLGGSITPYPYLASASLLNADANDGPKVISAPYFAGVELQMQAIKATGAQAVAVAVGFPMLYQPFLQANNQQYSQYAAFYAKVAASARALGLKLIVENDIMISSGPAGTAWNSQGYLSGLTWQQYTQARAQAAVAIAQTMQPDYLVVLEEPDTEAANSGQTQAQSPGGATELVAAELAALQQAKVSGISVGAGVGTWLYEFDQYIQSFVTLPLDFIDFHIYQINGENLPNALTIASIAASAGLPVSMTECWLHKIRDSEVGGTLTQAQIRARNVYSFWGPLDVDFIKTMEVLGNYLKMGFVNFFEPDFFWSYIPYDNTTANTPPNQLLMDENLAANHANQIAQYNGTGMNFYHSVVKSPDKIPPTTPTNLTGVSGATTGAFISWTASTDNVGVAGYYVLRDGVKVATVGTTFFQDSGLTESTTYTYSVEAFDLGGNISTAAASIQVMTKDVTPPPAPATLSATAMSSVKVQLTWPASTDADGIRAYWIYSGTSSSKLTKVAAVLNVTTSFNLTGLSPATTYYFGVEAVDTSGNISAMSPVATSNTPAMPVAPANVTAAAASTNRINVNWSASTGGLPIAYYQIYRGSSAASLAKFAIRVTPSLIDDTVVPGTAYYYAVVAVDKAYDNSPQSTTVSAQTPTPPTAPAKLKGSALSNVEVKLSWVASTGSLPIAAYRIYRGMSSTSMAQVHLVTAPASSFEDTGLAPASTHYYAIQAVDADGDASPMSNVIKVTTP